MQRSHNTTDIVVLLYCIVLFVQKLVNYREGDELIEQWVVSPAPGTVIYVLRTWSVHSRQTLGPPLSLSHSLSLSGKSRLFHYKQKHCQLSSQTQNQSCTAPIFLSLILKIAYLALCNPTSYLRFHTNTFQRDEGGVFAVDHLGDSLEQERQR